MNLIKAKDAHDMTAKVIKNELEIYNEELRNIRMTMLSDEKRDQYAKIINDLIISQANQGLAAVDIPIDSGIDLNVCELGLNPNLSDVLDKLKENGFRIDRFFKRTDNRYEITIYWHNVC